MSLVFDLQEKGAEPDPFVRDCLVRALSTRWWLCGEQNERIDKALMYGVAKSWQFKVNCCLERNKANRKQPKSQEELSHRIGIDRVNLFLRGGHSTTLTRFLLMAQHLGVPMCELLPDEVDIIANAACLLIQLDSSVPPSDDLFDESVVYAIFQIHRNWDCEHPFHLTGLNRVFSMLNESLPLRTKRIVPLDWNLSMLQSSVLKTASRLKTVLQLAYNS